MAQTTKRGKLISVSDYAVEDIFVGSPVLDVKLEQDDGTEISARVPMGVRFSLHFDLICNPGMSAYIIGQAFLDFDPLAVTREGRHFSNDPYYPVVPEREYFYEACLVRPAIGDKVEISWDYVNFDGRIIAIEPGRAPIPAEMPITDRRAFHQGDILDSFNPE